MPTTTAVTDWGVATWTGITAGLATFYGYIPNIIGAIVILLVGWLIATILYTVTDKLLDAVRFDALMARAGIDDMINRSGVRIDPSNLVATFVKWVVLLVAFMAAAEQLHLTQVSMGISAILAYIPNVIGAVIILALGLFLANFVSRLVRGAAASAGMRASDLVADVAYWAVTIFAVLGAIGQLNIAPTLVQTIYTALIAAVALAAALAFGLGLREQARDVVAGRALMDHVHDGDEIAIERVSGRVEKVGTIKTLIRSAEGLISVPNHMLADQVFRVGGRLAPAGGGGGGKLPTTPTPPVSETIEGGETDTAPLRPTEHQWRPKPENPRDV